MQNYAVLAEKKCFASVAATPYTQQCSTDIAPRLPALFLNVEDASPGSRGGLILPCSPGWSLLLLSVVRGELW